MITQVVLAPSGRLLSGLAASCRLSLRHFSMLLLLVVLVEHWGKGNILPITGGISDPLNGANHGWGQCGIL
jgi:hypothetical protein